MLFASPEKIKFFAAKIQDEDPEISQKLMEKAKEIEDIQKEEDAQKRKEHVQKRVGREGR